MKYLGKITDGKDLVTKEYVDSADTTGNSATTTKLKNAVNIGTTGITSNPASFNGSSSVNIAVTDVPASLVSVVDSGNHFTATNVENVLAELFQDIPTIVLNTWGAST